MAASRVGDVAATTTGCLSCCCRAMQLLQGLRRNVRAGPAEAPVCLAA